MYVHQFNEQQRQLAAGQASTSAGSLSAAAGAVPLRVVLGGTTILNSATFLADLAGGKLGASQAAARDMSSSTVGFGAAAGGGASSSGASAFDPRRLAQLAASPLASVLGTTSTTSKTA